MKPINDSPEAARFQGVWPILELGTREQLVEIERVESIRHKVYAGTNFDHRDGERTNRQIFVYPDERTFYRSMALQVIRWVKENNKAGKDSHGIFPVGPVPWYEDLVDIANSLDVSFTRFFWHGMDEVVIDGKVVNEWHPISFKGIVLRMVYNKLKPHLRPDMNQFVFPNFENLDTYGDELFQDDEVEYRVWAGCGWAGHLAYVDPTTGIPYVNDPESFYNLGAMYVKLDALTVIQNAFHTCRGSIMRAPKEAVSIGPKHWMHKNAKHVDVWCDGLVDGGQGWQNSIARILAFYDPELATPLIPCTSLAVKAKRDPGSVSIHLLERVARDPVVELH